MHSVKLRRVAFFMDLERENAELPGKIQSYEDAIQRNNLWHFFRPRREKAAMRDNAR